MAHTLPSSFAPARSARIALFIALVLKAAGLSLFVVLMPPLSRQMGFTDIETGMIMSLSALAGIVAAPVWGFLTERAGRKPVLLAGMLVPAACLGLTAALVEMRLSLAISAGLALAAVFAVRVLQAAFSGSVLPAAQAHMADTTGRQQRVQGMGFLGSSFGLGAILGGMVAWRIGGSAPTVSFAVLAGLAFAAGLAVWLCLPETRGRSLAADRETVPTSAPASLARLWPHFAITLLAVAIYGTLQQVMALRLQDYYGIGAEASVSRAGFILAAAAICMITVQGIVIRHLAWSPRAFLMRGAVLAALAMAGFWAATGPATLLASMMAFGAGLGLLFPGNLGAISLSAPARAQGKAAGINATFQGLGMACGPLLGAVLNAHSFAAVPALCIALLLVAATLARIGAPHPDTAALSATPAKPQP
ncbi:MFS transporter [Stappia indica]|uniref:MFS transporter n=1 Tax=Stappia indica TaxID=538381 RepID=UPI0008356C87|nr:MFS transporter [Stappia indica]